MKRKFKIILIALLFCAVVALIALYMGSHNIPVLDPQGMIAGEQRKLLLTASWLMLIIVIPVFILMGVFAWKYREGNRKAKYTPNWDHHHVLELVCWGIPFLIVVALSVLTWTSTHALNPFKPIVGEQKPITIQVVALQWKWLFIYPEQGIATVNFVQFPEKTPIAFEITADAPMNSFWIPALGGQIYAMPAMRTELHLMASEVGTYRGCSANISGTGFAGMHFKAQSCTEGDFKAWIKAVKGSSSSLGLSGYEALAKPSEDNPVTSYVLGQSDLFNQVLMKGMSR
jgi:cytochrome o ubiquinol oxidase subunit 2